MTISAAGLSDAFAYAAQRHATQRRKGTTTPYISHLMQVAGLVLEAGGDEQQAIAGLLHDAIEDAPPGEADQVRRDIEHRFGKRVLKIVEGCTDADVQPKPEWWTRKRQYLEHLPHAGDDVLLVSAADKVHNARAILTDLKEHGAALWERFRTGRKGTLWYYRELVSAYREAGAAKRLLEELEIAVEEIERLAGSNNGWMSDEHRWETPGLTPGESSRRQRGNIGSLRRKITYCIKRPDTKLQFQTVESWTTGRILGYMEGRGIDRARIERDLPRSDAISATESG